MKSDDNPDEPRNTGFNFEWVSLEAAFKQASLTPNLHLAMLVISASIDRGTLDSLQGVPGSESMADCNNIKEKFKTLNHGMIAVHCLCLVFFTAEIFLARLPKPSSSLHLLLTSATLILSFAYHSLILTIACFTATDLPNLVGSCKRHVILDLKQPFLEQFVLGDTRALCYIELTVFFSQMLAIIGWKLQVYLLRPVYLS